MMSKVVVVVRREVVVPLQEVVMTGDIKIDGGSFKHLDSCLSHNLSAQYDAKIKVCEILNTISCREESV